MRVLDQPLVFVDVETNGLSHTRGRVIEVAAIRVENGRMAASINQLIDPDTDIPPFISQLTGITAADLKSAPCFADIAGELYEIMEGAVFVAHNVRFDYGFLKQEFKRIGMKFAPKQLCTVRLSKAVFPGDSSHKLQAVIDRCGISVKKRHRAYDDALALWQFIKYLDSTLEPEILRQAISQQLRTPSLPKSLTPGTVASLPSGPGVYIFEDGNGSPLYIGKSVNIKKRVLSHFSRDHEHEGEFKISQQVAHIGFIETSGELDALLLESRLIKQKQPLYNKLLRRMQKLTLVRQKRDDEGYIRLTMEDVAAINPKDTSDILAVYPTKGKARTYLNQAVRDFMLCPKLLGMEKSSGACFLYQLRKCAGACNGSETAERHNQRLLEVFHDKRIEQWPFSTPVAITERGYDNPKSIIVDQWCLLAEVFEQSDLPPAIKYHDKIFDIDTYNILRSFIASHRAKLSIKTVSLAELRRMPELVEV